MKFYTMLAMIAATATLTLTGCRVEKTEEGNLPEVDVQTRGETNLPKYDVDAADVDVGTTETQMTMPTVDINMPPENEATPVPAPE
jgi:hypothetical protein